MKTPELLRAGYFLEIEAEGMPRHVGVFSFDFQAENWAHKHVKNGSWTVVPMMKPKAAF